MQLQACTLSGQELPTEGSSSHKAQFIRSSIRLCTSAPVKELHLEASARANGAELCHAPHVPHLHSVLILKYLHSATTCSWSGFILSSTHTLPQSQTPQLQASLSAHCQKLDSEKPAAKTQAFEELYPDRQSAALRQCQVQSQARHMPHLKQQWRAGCSANGDQLKACQLLLSLLQTEFRGLSYASRP